MSALGSRYGGTSPWRASPGNILAPIASKRSSEGPTHETFAARTSVRPSPSEAKADPPFHPRRHYSCHTGEFASSHTVSSSSNQLHTGTRDTIITGAPTANIFINYRRGDSAPYAGRLCDQLNILLGAHH